MQYLSLWPLGGTVGQPCLLALPLWDMGIVIITRGYDKMVEHSLLQFLAANGDVPLSGCRVSHPIGHNYCVIESNM
jgi:hypothetical protein